VDARRLAAWMCVASLAAGALAAQPPDGTTLRVATFNLHDVRTADINTPNQPRLRRLAEVIQRVRPNIILLNEIAYDVPGAPDVPEDAPGGENARNFANRFLAIAQATDTQPLHYKVFMAPVNSGMPSGFDFDHDGKVTTIYPLPPRPGADGSPPPIANEGRTYAADCWGFGTFPGQYGMALLVDDRLDILADQVRTFRLLPWDDMPGGFIPKAPDGKGDWFNDEQKKVARLSSRSHWDVPVRLPGGAVVHFLCSHAAAPAPDGPEKFNARRNHDEIRFWADYVENAGYLVDDKNHPGGLDATASFVILGDLNADPTKGTSFKDPLRTALLSARRINGSIVPKADLPWPALGPSDTAADGLRLDYVLPSRDLPIAAAGIWRAAPAGSDGFPSDHFPVWMEVVVPMPKAP
jgi:endonuclease/exonuclease/phosphatase family metal-dependent hydrolase